MISGVDGLRFATDFDSVRKELTEITKLGVTLGLAFTAVTIVGLLGLERVLRLKPMREETESQQDARFLVALTVRIAFFVLGLGAIWVVILGVRDWMEKRIQDIWEEEVWDADRLRGKENAKSHETESTAWLNALIASVWPLVNPDLFTSLADTLEDVMQASLPKMVRMVSVDDIGQGSEALRILGVRWLPTAAAARSVGSDGKLQKADEKQHQSDRTVPGEGEVDDKTDQKGSDETDQKDKKDEKDKGDSAEKSQQGQEVAEGMEAEEGDFVNVEVAFAYKARSKKMKHRSQDAHLMLGFYLPGNLKIPVWVDLRGIVGIMRLRLQLAPDPPFFALCTLTFLGQPKVDLSCIPLSRHAVNIMDVPLISNFVQSAVDAAMAEYVAPKSLTLDLKDMLAGDDFKKDTVARGVLVVHIKRGHDFKCGDPGIPLIKDGSADPYVSVGWAKFGKPVWSTRVLISEMEPWWDETAFILVTPQELNVDERLRVQLWDSDRTTADDDLGRIELDLKQLMKNPESNGKMWKRSDGFRALKAGEGMPGKLEWEVGYYSKTRLQQCQFEQQTFDKEVKSTDQLKDKVDKIITSKLREKKREDESEVEQQKAQEFKSMSDQMIISAPPPQDYPSGILSIQIHQITGLELEKINKNQADKDATSDDEQEGGESLPSAYCTLIINHNKVFKTRTKPKNAKPFYNAGTERFIRDWRTTEVYLSVRDSRVHEDDPLLGIVHLPLSEIFKERSQFNGFYPLTGGIGYGRVRISMCWRSVQLHAPPELLGWQVGTLEIDPTAEAVDMPQNLKADHLKFITTIGSGRMWPKKGENKWARRHGRTLHLAVQKRYSTYLAIQVRNSSTLHKTIAAFAVLWLKDIPDEEEQTLTLPVWKGDYKRATACTLPECGEKVGSIKVKLRFWAGLSPFHDKVVSKDRELGDIAEVLDVARDNYENEDQEKEAIALGGDKDHGSGSDSSASSDDEGSKDPRSKEDAEGGDVDRKKGSGGDGGLADSLKGYKKDAKGLHRRNRGLMQWKVRTRLTNESSSANAQQIPRTAQWAKHKLEHGESKISSMFHHHARDPGIETEV